MPDSKQIKSILQELYALDPSLKEQEAELSKAVLLLLESKPDVHIDRAFLKKVRTQLLEKATTMMNSKKPAELASAAPKRSMFWPAIGISFSGVAVIAMASFFVMQNASLIPGKTKPSGSVASDRSANALFTSVKINHVARTAFGSLAGASAGSEVSPKAMALGTGAGMNNMSARAVAVEPPSQKGPVPMVETGSVSTMDAGVSANVIDSKMVMPPYEQTIIEYAYKGDAIELNDALLDVYKKMPGSFSAGTIASALRGMNLGVVNLGSFDGAKLGDFSVYQDQPYGYQIYVSPRNGYLSIDQNWDQWQGAYPNCKDESCWASSQLKEADMPADEELVALADAFLKDHGISHESYGNGRVDHSWKSVFVPADSIRYVPDVITVSYPLIIDNRETYQNGGTSYGITVMINVRVKKVTSVYNLQALSLDASSYDAVTDSNAILELAKTGGLGSYIRYMDEASKSSAKKAEAELGTPVRALVQYYQYKDGQSIELFVPALIFPVTKKPDVDQWSQDYVIVPLVKGIESDAPEVYPMRGGGVSGAESGSAGGTAGGAGMKNAAGVEVVAPTPPVEPKKAR